MKKILFTLIIGFFVCFFSTNLFAEEKLFSINFDQATGNAKNWLKNNGFEQKGLGSIPFDTHFKDGELIITHKKKGYGLYGKEIKIDGVKKLRIVWGIKEPFGVEKRKPAVRENLMLHITLSFGEEKISSGSAFVPKLPYFISFILAEHADKNTFYQGKYYKKGGRYYCVSCPIKNNEVITSEIDLLPVLQKAFNFTEIPPVTLISFGIDNRQANSNAITFIQKIEFLGEPTI